MTAPTTPALDREAETLEQYAERIVAATRRHMMDRLDDDVIGCLGESHLIFGKACAMEVTTAMREVQEGLDATRPLVARADLAEALKPFSEAADDLDDDHRHGSDIWEAPAAMAITAGHLRRARQLHEALTQASAAKVPEGALKWAQTLRDLADDNPGGGARLSAHVLRSIANSLAATPSETTNDQ